MAFPRIAKLKTHEDFTGRISELNIDLPCDSDSPDPESCHLAQSSEVDGMKIGNRFCILPMEGWDGTTDGKPTDLTRRRWNNFGLSGAKLIWGGEACAVRHDGRANPNQLIINDANLADIESLRTGLVDEHAKHFSTTDDLLVGLQLTHSGRFARPNDKKKLEPRTGHRNAALDRKLGLTDDSEVLTDDELSTLADEFVAAAVMAEKAGYAFVDVKHCHGYLGHELLSGVDRPGKYGGSLENRTRFLRDIVTGVKAEAPSLKIGVRVSIFDFFPYRPGADGIGEPDSMGEPQLAFGGDETGLGINLDEPSQFMKILKELGIRLVCTTAGSPYYNPHIQRPAFFPPSDGYQPPEDPLVGVARQINATAQLKRENPEMFFVGSGYSYLQEWLPNVGEAVVRESMADSIGLGRMVLSYPDLPADVFKGSVMARKKICRTFSDCTTAPRNGIISGCYPLDPFYKKMPEREQVNEFKKAALPAKG